MARKKKNKAPLWWGVCLTFALGAGALYLHFSNLVVVLMEGGLVSQMYQYIVGQHMKDLGYNVKYSLKFYDRGCRDTYNEFARDFQLLKAFPYLEVPRANWVERVVCCRFFFYKNKTEHEDKAEDHFDYLKAKPPVYLGEYHYNVALGTVDTETWPIRYGAAPYEQYFHFDENTLSAASKEVLERIQNMPTPVGVHVRLGDYNGGRGKAPSASLVEYFVKAITFLRGKFPDAHFFFFSEEPDLVRRFILPRVPQEIPCTMVDINSSGDCFMDLFLLSACKHQVMWCGSWHGPAHALNQYPGKILITPGNLEKMLLQESSP
ncbi:MAG: alpha-1,2-fucosyltransferase [Holosporales bacterium]|jgi:hypothetical protein|nr:alpha-1,2-fucosyltransferase [Holosporales bacterium]